MKKSWVRAHKSTLDSCCKRILDSISYKKKLDMNSSKKHLDKKKITEFTVNKDLTLLPLGRHTFYPQDRISRDKA